VTAGKKVSMSFQNLRRAARPAAVAAFAVAAAALAACGSSTPALNATTVEQAIAKSVLAQRALHVTVSCPAKIPSRTGTHFACTARLDVGTYPVPGVVTNDRGHVVYSNSSPLVALDSHRVEASITRSILAQRGVRARVQCPAEVLQQAHLRFTCPAQFGGRAHAFSVVEVDGSGRVRYAELPAAG
jgi:Domain of unknown function (DUF4333)